uniref:FZ domain-containing protein n=1 Tax=Bombyx mori TaxID=7091 RepID=A0A8R2LU66_BOMMO|nr:uncharacterized protein LOC101747221 isoform X2 [Bombyx mori]
MVNGNYVLYGDKPSSESEIVDDHVHKRTVDRKTKRRSRTANELQRSLNVRQLDNETDSVKYEKKINEPRLLRYVPTTDVEENYVTEKFETYDLKPTEERPRKYAFTKKPKNPTDGSINYAYSRSSSSCSSPNGNLPTISEHGEQYGNYRVHSFSGAVIDDVVTGYETKLDKYFSKPREVKTFAAKGSHPDSLYRVPVDSGVARTKMTRVVRVIRWPAALVAVCVALAVFVYFLMPDTIDIDVDSVNGTTWEAARAHNNVLPHKFEESKVKKNDNDRAQTQDFYDADNDKSYDITAIIDTITETDPKRVLPVAPIFPSHITPEVQYGNERVDKDKLRTPKVINETNTFHEDSTLKPHITQKPEKPLEVYFRDVTAIPTTTESIFRAETVNDFTNYEEKQTTKKIEEASSKHRPSLYKQNFVQLPNGVQDVEASSEIPLEVQEYYGEQPVKSNVNFTSGHSKLFGISMEDAEKIKSTTQSSVYNTRVSPTLPTWRDGDDATTKKYPTNINYEVPQCHSTHIPLCRGVLPYDLAGNAASVGGIEITALLPQIEYLVATNCSDRVRHFVCALLEPECNPPPYPPKLPCFNLCKAIVDNCDGLIPRDLSPAFNCQQYFKNNCIAAKTPCYPREMTCGDGSCIPRDWICDGTRDCLSGEDEATCVQCDTREFRCPSGGCIQKRWLCDGYADCSNGEDEDVEVCGSPVVAGEEPAGSAPAPAVRRPNRMQNSHGRQYSHNTGENESSKELLVTSDSSNSLKRNFTRRPSLSRLTPYNRNMPHTIQTRHNNTQTTTAPVTKHSSQDNERTTQNADDGDSEEDVNVGDLGFFEDLKKEPKEQPAKRVIAKSQMTKPKSSIEKDAGGGAPAPTRLDQSISKLERVINGAALLKKAEAESKSEKAEELEESPEMNKGGTRSDDLPTGPRGGSTSAHVSPCPTGELRCVDGRCITLAQLCDGTIDCSDHADEDNCFT